METAAGEAVRIEAVYQVPRQQIIPFAAILLGEETVVADPQAEIEAAVAAHKAADVAVVVVGTTLPLDQRASTGKTSSCPATRTSWWGPWPL